MKARPISFKLMDIPNHYGQKLFIKINLSHLLCPLVSTIDINVPAISIQGMPLHKQTCIAMTCMLLRKFLVP